MSASTTSLHPALSHGSAPSPNTMMLAKGNITTPFNPLLSNPPATAQESIAANAAATTTLVATTNAAVAATAATAATVTAVTAVAATTAATAILTSAAAAESLQRSPPKKGWTAQAARPQNQPKKNASQMATAAKAAKALSAQHRLQGPSSYSSLALSDFPVPGKAMATAMRPGLLRSISYNKEESVESDTYSLKAGSMRGLGIHPSRSLAQLSNVSEPSRTSGRRPSYGSTGSAARSQTCNSLGDGVGFTFKGTTNFVHPNRQVPRSYCSPSRSHTASTLSVGYEDEGDEVVVERMNSVTSDGGWKAGWSVGGGSLSGPTKTASTENLEQIDARGDSTIVEEDYESDRSPGPRQVPFREPSPTRTISPTRKASPTVDETSSGSSARSGRSLVARKPSLSHILRSRSRDVDEQSPSSSPIRDSIDKAVGIFSRNVEPEDSVSRSASIAAARLAFEEKEAAKDRKYAEKEAKKEIRRRASDAKLMRRPSNAVDSAFDSSENSPTYGHARSGSVARSSSIARASSIVRSNSFVAGFGGFAAAFTSRPISPSEEDDESRDPLSRVPELEHESSPLESAQFPEYQEAQPAQQQQQDHDHSMFPAAWQETAQQKAPVIGQQLEAWEQEGALYSSTGVTPIEEISVNNSGLFPPPMPSSKQGGAAVYTIDGKMYDEFGMPIHQIILPANLRAQHQQQEYNDGPAGFDGRGRRPSMTKQAKGKFNKFSAWGKTRLLRV